MNVADRDPGLLTGRHLVELDVEPSRSAQRTYIRSSISAQSWLSVPPAPELTSHTASNSSYSPVNSARSSSSRVLAFELRDRGGDLGLLGLVELLPRQLGERRSVLDPRRQALVEREVRVGSGELALHLLRDLRVIPQVGASQLGLELRTTQAQLVDPQVLVGLVQATRQVGQRGREVLHSRSPVALLELLATAARARAVARGLLQVGLHDRGLRHWLSGSATSGAPSRAAAAVAARSPESGPAEGSSGDV